MNFKVDNQGRITDEKGFVLVNWTAETLLEAMDEELNDPETTEEEKKKIMELIYSIVATL